MTTHCTTKVIELSYLGIIHQLGQNVLKIKAHLYVNCSIVAITQTGIFNVTDRYLSCFSNAMIQQK